MLPLAICHRCETRKGDACRESGCSIRAHKRAAYCPLGKFGTNQKPADFQCVPPSASTPPPSVPLPDWPRWAKLVAVMKTDADKGVGDSLHRISSSAPQRLIGLAKELKKWWRGTKSCQCEADRRRYNAMYPYAE